MRICEIPEGINLLDIQWTQRFTSETVLKFCIKSSLYYYDQQKIISSV